MWEVQVMLTPQSASVAHSDFGAGPLLPIGFAALGSGRGWTGLGCAAGSVAAAHAAASVIAMTESAL